MPDPALAPLFTRVWCWNVEGTHLIDLGPAYPHPVNPKMAVVRPFGEDMFFARTHIFASPRAALAVKRRHLRAEAKDFARRQAAASKAALRACEKAEGEMKNAR